MFNQIQQIATQVGKVLITSGLALTLGGINLPAQAQVSVQITSMEAATCGVECSGIKVNWNVFISRVQKLHSFKLEAIPLTTCTGCFVGTLTTNVSGIQRSGTVGITSAGSFSGSFKVKLTAFCTSLITVPGSTTTTPILCGTAEKTQSF